MNKELFNEVWSEFEQYFRLSTLSDAQYAQYFKSLKHIPDEAMKWIRAAYIRSHKPMPANFPTIDDLLASWQIWKKNNPGKMVQDERPWCDYCGGLGRIEAKKYNEHVKYDAKHVFNCGHCSPPLWSAWIQTKKTWQLEREGYKIIPHGRVPPGVDDERVRFGPAEKETLTEKGVK